VSLYFKVIKRRPEAFSAFHSADPKNVSELFICPVHISKSGMWPNYFNQLIYLDSIPICPMHLILCPEFRKQQGT
jgi:hypothetical protein